MSTNGIKPVTSPKIKPMLADEIKKQAAAERANMDLIDQVQMDDPVKALELGIKQMSVEVDLAKLNFERTKFKIQFMSENSAVYASNEKVRALVDSL